MRRVQPDPLYAYTTYLSRVDAGLHHYHMQARTFDQSAHQYHGAVRVRRVSENLVHPFSSVTMFPLDSYFSVYSQVPPNV